MEGKRKIIIAVIAVLVISILGLGIAFAAFSKSLTINGNATVQTSNWNVYFSADPENCSNPGSNGVSIPTSRILEIGTGHVVSTLLTSDTLTWSATLKSPGDAIELEFFVCNSGDYDADISLTSGLTNFQYGEGNLNLTCTQNGVVTQEAATVCSHLNSGLTINDNVAAHLESPARKDIYIGLDDEGWAQDGSDLPKNPVTVTAAPIVLTATQSSSAH